MSGPQAQGLSHGYGGNPAAVVSVDRTPGTAVSGEIGTTEEGTSV